MSFCAFFEDFDGPIAIGLRSGHVSHENVTLTFGVEAELRRLRRRNPGNDGAGCGGDRD